MDSSRALYESLRDYFGITWPYSADMPAIWEIGLGQLSVDEKRHAISVLLHTPQTHPPTLGEVMAMAQNRMTPKELGAAFDLNPLIDGTSKWDADRESHAQRKARRKEYILSQRIDTARLNNERSA